MTTALQGPTEAPPCEIQQLEINFASLPEAELTLLRNILEIKLRAKSHARSVSDTSPLGTLSRMSALKHSHELENLRTNGKTHTVDFDPASGKFTITITTRSRIGILKLGKKTHQSTLIVAPRHFQLLESSEENPWLSTKRLSLATEQMPPRSVIEKQNIFPTPSNAQYSPEDRTYTHRGVALDSPEGMHLEELLIECRDQIQAAATELGIIRES